ncbi:MAG: hypothetical protein QM831_25620 [Kofleriaceae bacterium]
MKKTLVLAGPKPKKAALEVVGKKLTSTTWNAKGTPKAATKTLASAEVAAREFDKALRKKLRDDYVVLAPAERGKIMLEAFAGGGGGGPELDMSLDGKYLVTASMTTGSNFGVTLELIEIETGLRTVLLKEPAGVRQNFLHGPLFDRTGKGIYFVLRDALEYIDIATKKRTVISKEADVNYHVVQPSFDAERKRLVIFDRSLVRVIDEQRKKLCEVDTKSTTTECRGAAISGSGRYLALYIVSRGIVYSHDDAKSDTTNLVHIYDVETGSLWETITVDQQVDDLGFTPDETQLVVTYYYAKGPVGLRIPSGEQAWAIRGDDKDLAYNRDWAFAPGGKSLALSGRRPRVVTFPGLKPVEIEDAGFGRPEHVIVSADGKRLAAYVGGTAYVWAL